MRLARAKLEHPLYACALRVFALSRSGDNRAFHLCKTIGSALGVFNAPGSGSVGTASGAQSAGNGLIALSNNDPQATHPHSLYPDRLHFHDVLERTTHRAGMLLSLPELAGLVHPPAESVQHPRLVRFDPRERSLPDHLLEAEGALLGIHRFRSQEQPLVWPDAYRNRHAYILGATRMGKSTLLLNMIVQDMSAGRGLCLIDPHGDLALDILHRVPPERAGDVIYLDLSDREYPLALGLLEAADEDERRLLCSDVLSVLKRLFASSWGDRLEHILRHAILTLLSASQTSYGSNGSGTSNGRTYTERTYTLRDIRPLLSNKAFRERVIHDLDDLELKAFWTGEFVSYSSSHFAPLYNKLGLLLSSPLVRNIIAQKQSKLSYTEVMQNRQILIVNLASSRIGNDNAHFLGALLVSKLQIAAMQSLRLGQAQRTPFTLYVDEFQNFVVSSFETILSEAGKAGLSLMMANQFLEQLNGNLQTAILGNVGTLCSFRVSSDSGRLLEKEMAGCFKSGDLVSLNRGEAVARIGSARDSFLIETLPPPPMPSTSPAAMIRDQSRAGVCRPRGEVEVELSEEAARQAALEYEEEQAALAAKAREKEREAERKRLDEERKQAVRDDEVRRKQEEKQAEADRKRRETERKRQEAERLRQERRQEEENQRQAQKPGGHQARQDNRQSGTPKPVAMPQPVQKSQLVQKPIAAETRPDAGDGAKHSSTDRATGLEEPFELGARVPPQDEKTPPVPVEPECFGVPDEP